MWPGLWLNWALWREALKYDSGVLKYLHTEAFTQNSFHESKGFPFIYKEKALSKLPPFDHLQSFKLIYSHSHLLLPLCSSRLLSKVFFARTGVPSPPDFSRLPPWLSLSVLCCSVLSYISWFSVCSINYWDAASLVVQMVKNPPAMQETQAQSLGQEDPLEEGMAMHSSILAWRIPWAEEPGGLQSMGSHRVEVGIFKSLTVNLGSAYFSLQFYKFLLHVFWSSVIRCIN